MALGQAGWAVQVHGGWRRARVQHLLPREPQALQTVEQPPHRGLVEPRSSEHALELRHELGMIEAMQGRGRHQQRRILGRRGRLLLPC